MRERAKYPMLALALAALGAMTPASADDSAAGNFGRIMSVADLPQDRAVAAYVKKAAALNDAVVKKSPRPRAGGTSRKWKYE